MFKNIFVMTGLSILLMSGCGDSSTEEGKKDFGKKNPPVVTKGAMLKQAEEFLHSTAPNTSDADFNKSEFGQSLRTTQAIRKSNRAHMLVATATDPDPEWFGTKTDRHIIYAQVGKEYTVTLKKMREDGTTYAPVDKDKLRLVVVIQRGDNSFDMVTNIDINKYVEWAGDGSLHIHIPQSLDNTRLLIGVRPYFEDVAQTAIAERWSTLITVETWHKKSDVKDIATTSMVFPVDTPTKFAADSKFSVEEVGTKIQEYIKKDGLFSFPLILKESTLKEHDLVSFNFDGKNYAGEVFFSKITGTQQFVLLRPDTEKVYEKFTLADDEVVRLGLYPEHIIYREGGVLSSDTNESDPTSFGKNSRGIGGETWELDCSTGGAILTYEPILSLAPVKFGIDLSLMAASADTECSLKVSVKTLAKKAMKYTGNLADFVEKFGLDVDFGPYGYTSVSTKGLPNVGFNIGWNNIDKGYFTQPKISTTEFMGEVDLGAGVEPFEGTTNVALGVGVGFKLKSDFKTGYLVVFSEYISDIDIDIKAEPNVAISTEILNAKKIYESKKDTMVAVAASVDIGIGIPSVSYLIEMLGLDTLVSINPRIELELLKEKVSFGYGRILDDGEGNAKIYDLKPKSRFLRAILPEAIGVLAPMASTSSVFNDKDNSISYSLEECKNNNDEIRSPAIACAGWMCGKVDRKVKLCTGNLTVSRVIASAKVKKTAKGTAKIINKASTLDIEIQVTPMAPASSKITMEGASDATVAFAMECKKAGVFRGITKVQAVGAPWSDEAENIVVCHDDDFKGDPHIVTADKLGYDFFASGDYIISRIQGVDDFEIQARFLPGYKTSWPQAMALRVGNDTVEIQGKSMKLARTYRFNALIIWVNGKKQILNSNYIELPSGGIIAITSTKLDINHHKYASGVTVIWPKDSQAKNYGVILSVAEKNDPFVAIQLARPKDFSGQEEGLMGNNNGDPSDDFKRRDGQQLGKDTPMSFTALYALFGADWLVRESESLFRNPTAIKPSFPTSATVLTPAQRALGVSACSALTGYYREACIMDVGLTGRTDIVQEYYADSKDLNALSEKIVPPNTEGKVETLYTLTTEKKEEYADSTKKKMHYKQTLQIKRTQGSEGGFIVMLQPPRAAKASLSNGMLSFDAQGDTNLSIEVDCSQKYVETDLDIYKKGGSVELWRQNPLTGTASKQYSSIALSCQRNTVLKTGQTISYVDFDDGDYQKGDERSYSRDDADEIVTDNTTRLKWQDNSDVKILGKNWDDAKKYCQNLTLGGFTDWRLPSRKELVSLVDFGRVSPAINPVFKNVSPGNWSSSIYYGYGQAIDYANLDYYKDTDFIGIDAWTVSFNDGSLYHDGKEMHSAVRCVK